MRDSAVAVAMSVTKVADISSFPTVPGSAPLHQHRVDHGEAVVESAIPAISSPCRSSRAA